jgi:CRP-like cAMP-binding protein
MSSRQSSRVATRIVEPRRNGRSNCSACDLREVMVCSDVTVEQLADFHTWIDDLAIPDGVYCIRKGSVKLIRYSNSGGQRIVRIVKRGDVVGMEAVFSDRFEHTAVAVGEVVACRIPLVNFRRMVDDNPTLQRRLLARSQQALREAETWLSELAGGSAQARERMARLLLRLRDGQSGDILRLSLDDLGAILGITMETASRILADFSRQGLLSRHGVGKRTSSYRADIDGLARIASGGDSD